MSSIGSDIIVEGDTTTFRVVASKDDEVWDISSGTVSLTLKKPSGTLVGPLSATVTDGPSGKAQYTTTVNTLDEPGYWLRQWNISKAGVVLSSRRIKFEVGGLIE